MRILYILPRYDSAAMGNRIHTEVIHAWRESGITAEVLSLAANQAQPTRTVEDDIVVHRLPSRGTFVTQVVNRVVNPLFSYPYLASAIVACAGFWQRRRHLICVTSKRRFRWGLPRCLPAGMLHR